MKWFRTTLKESRLFIFGLILVEAFTMVEGHNFVQAYQKHQAEQARWQEMADFLDLPVEKLEPRHHDLLEPLWSWFGDETKSELAAQRDTLQRLLRQHEAQLANHPWKAQIEALEAAHQPYRVGGVLRDLKRLLNPEDGAALSAEAKRTLLENLQAASRQGLGLERSGEGVGLVSDKTRRLEGMLSDVEAALQTIDLQTVGSEKRQDNLDEGAIEDILQSLRSRLGASFAGDKRAPRFVEDGLPLKRVEKQAPRRPADAGRAFESPNRLSAPPSAMPAQIVGAAARGNDGALKAAAPELMDLVNRLDRSPAKIFRFVHDELESDAKWGAYKGPLGTYLERRGTAWDQAWLLRELLDEIGVDARFEWGEVEIDPDQLLALAGVDDPLVAGNLLSTAGLPVVLLTAGSRVVAARMPHVWVRAHLDYVPHRGALHQEPDTWVRMDPYLKNSVVQVGNPVYRQVPFTLESYLQSATAESPRRSYEDDLTVYNVEADLWSDLDEIRHKVEVQREGFPFVPGTLRAKIVSLEGQGVEVPAAVQAQVALRIEAASGLALLDWTASAPALYGQRVEIAYEGATAADQQLLDDHGGIFATPPYLVELAPEVRIQGVTAASGNAIGSGEDVRVWMTLEQPGVTSQPRRHDVLAGERHVLAYDWDRLPTELLQRHLALQQQALQAGDDVTVAGETLYLLAATYMRNLAQDLSDLSAIRWHRMVSLGTQGLITQAGRVTTDLNGNPITFEPDVRNVDIAAMTLGLFPVTSADAAHSISTLELLGAQSSFLEGTVFSEVVGRDGIASVSALTRSKREGQSLTRVDSANVEAVLAAADLGNDVEQAVRAATARGQIAWVAEQRLEIGDWRGTGYVLEDPSTGAAGYLISGGLGGGMEIGDFTSLARKTLGRESWLAETPIGKMLLFFLQLIESSPPPAGPNGSHGDPVNLSNGNLWTHAYDLWVQAPGIPITWTRTYNSQSTSSGSFGHGWTFSYGERLVPELDGTVVYIEADGTELPFTFDGAAYQAPPGRHEILQQEAGGYVLSTLNGTFIDFDTGGRMLRWRDANGNQVSLEYEGDALRYLRDTNGRLVLTVDQVDGKIVRVTDLSGRNVQYRYVGDDLVGMTDTEGNDWSYAYDDQHNLLARTNPKGHTQRWAYDSLDRCYQYIDPLGNVESYSYLGGGRAAVVRNAFGHPLYVEMDERGRATLSVDTLGNIHRSTWDADNNRLTVTDPRDGLTTMTYDEHGNVLTVTDSLGQVTTNTYKPGTKLLTSMETPEGLVTEYEYDAEGNLEKQTDTLDGVRFVKEMDHDSHGELIWTKDPEGHVRTFEWDAVTGGLEAQVDADLRRVEAVLDDLGRPTEISDDTGFKVELQYDGRDQITTLTNSLGHSWSRTYDELGRVLEQTSLSGTNRTDYDALGRTVAYTNEAGETRRREYDAVGNEVATTDYKGNRALKFFDAVGRPLAMVDPAGFVWSADFLHDLGDSVCNSCSLGLGGQTPGDVFQGTMSIINPLGQEFMQHLDILGRMTEMTNALGHTTTFTYDEANRKTSETDAEGRTTRWEWDDLGRLAAVVDGEEGRTEYRYDKLGQEIARIDANGHTWSQTWNAVGQRETATDPLGNTERWQRDPFGNVTAMINANDELIDYTHDVGRLTHIDLPDGSQSSFTYYDNGLIRSAGNAEKSLEFDYDILGRVTQVRDLTLGKTLEYEYDANGNRTRMVGPEGTVDYVYDSRDMLVTQHDSATGTFRYTYDGAGRRTSIVFPNGNVTEYVYDDAGQLIAVLTRNAAGQIIDGYRYVLDKSGLRTEMQVLRTGQTQRFEYDDAKRLTRWERGDGTFEEYAYDDVGNRETLVNSEGTTTYTYDMADRLEHEVIALSGGGSRRTDYDWDASGNLLSRIVEGGETTAYTWDAFDRLLQVDRGGDLVSYGYAPDGTRVRKTAQGIDERYLHSFDDLIGVYDGTGNAVSYFSFGPEVDQPLARKLGGAGDLIYMHHDAQGSITATSNGDGSLVGTALYSGFGVVDERSGELTRFGFTGREDDPETDLDYFRSRYYMADMGRFISVDWFRGVPNNPQTTHDYAFGGNDPVNVKDPSGKFWWFLLKWIFRILAVAVIAWIGAIVMRAVARLVVWIMWFMLSVVMALVIGFLCIYGWNSRNTRPYECLSQFATYLEGLFPFGMIFLQVGIILDLVLLLIMRHNGEISLTVARLLLAVILVKALLVYLTIEAIAALKDRPSIWKATLMMAAVVVWSYISEWVINFIIDWNPGQKPDSIMSLLPDAPPAPG